ncbi:uncharacterized protein LOC120635278 [Pararge aegeria]|uniref:uncharacterized protein LOC120635278 n=1 Tax=Pararge aegeria TaxID=116150 RepID=UPI0019D048AF|nr:uncharacterized protein LOC120635278 [Pararge aegeria]
MTLIGAILEKVQSKDSVKKYTSPPPEIDGTILQNKSKKRVDKFGHVRPVVDTSSPRYDAERMSRHLPKWTKHLNDLYYENVKILCGITNTYMSGGKVDSRWTVMPSGNKQYHQNRKDSCKIINRQNRQIYKRISKTGPRVVTTACLDVDWQRNKRDMVQQACYKFVLFPISSPETMDDLAFAASPGVKRPRVYITLRMRNAAQLGTLVAELFTDVCPDTCRLFLELLDGDGLGYGYVGTRFFRLVRQPNLQSLLSTNELSYELRKILISLIEAGARLAAAGRNYELTLAQLSAALDEPKRTQRIVAQVITPEELAAKLNNETVRDSDPDTSGSNDLYKRADCLERFLGKFRSWRRRILEPPNPEAIAALRNLGFSFEDAEEALRSTGCNVPAAASWLIGERGSSVFELLDGLPEGVILQTLLKQPQIQRGLLNTRMLIAFIAMVGQSGSASLWLNSPHGSPLLSQISRTYHSEKYCLAVNQFSERRENCTAPSTSNQRKVPHLFWSGGDVIIDNGFGCYAQKGRVRPILAENYHFSHSMPGLLSMRTTNDGELCGSFNITFKALPQFDLKNVVFGRIIRPCATYDVISTLGRPLSTHPIVEVAATRRRVNRHWVVGARNTKLRPATPKHVPTSL